jgi:flagellar basal-body rod protein FlgB
VDNEIKKGIQMEGANVFEAANAHARWLSYRERAIAKNIAFANVAGYKAIDIEPFSTREKELPLVTLVRSGTGLASAEKQLQTPREVAAKSWETSVSGNSVSIDEELVKSSDVMKGMGLNSAMCRAFQKIFLANVKG